MRNILTTLGLRKKTFREKIMDVDKKRLFLYAGLALGTVYGLRKAAPRVGEMLSGR
ncbi:MAG: hypothetical protein JWO03_328 [Bacteroidetes bacterium]|nr:hypothetical protein [Bacteroidota bacterium]